MPDQSIIAGGQFADIGGDQGAAVAKFSKDGERLDLAKTSEQMVPFSLFSPSKMIFF